MDHAQQGTGLPTMRTGHPSDEKRIERVRAVNIHDGLPGQGAFARSIQSQSKHQRMSIKEQETVIGEKGNVCVAKREKPVSACFSSSACRF
jgi:hypothetical protein